jgi:hypothetical protein
LIVTYTDVMQVHEAIIARLGGVRIFAMAFKFGVHSQNSLTLHVASKLKANNGITHVTVTLDPTDTYTVEFVRVPKRGAQAHVAIPVESVSFVHAPELKELVEAQTGLRLSL